MRNAGLVPPIDHNVSPRSGYKTAREMKLALSGLDLEKPYRHINCDAKGSASLLELVDSEFSKGNALAWTDFFVNAGGVSRSHRNEYSRSILTHGYPSRYVAM